MSDTQIIELDEEEPAPVARPRRAGSLTVVAMPIVITAAVIALLGIRGAAEPLARQNAAASSMPMPAFATTAAPTPMSIVIPTPRPGAFLESGDPEVLENQGWSGVGPTYKGRGDVAEAVLGGDAYVIGGSGTLEDGRLVYRYYAPTGMRLRVADLPVSLDHAMAATLGDRIFVFGGFVFGRASDRVFSIGANDATWSEHATMPAPRAAGGVAVVNDRAYIVGGVGQDGSWIRDVWMYDHGQLITGLAPIPTPRDHLAVGTYKGRVCAAGGNGGDHAFECYEPARNEWTKMPDLRRPAIGARAAEAAGWFFVVDQDVHAFTVDHWHFGPRLQTPRAGHALVVIQDALYVIEGAVGIETARMERLHPLP